MENRPAYSVEKPRAGARFTLDGSPELERHLARACERVREAVQEAVPSRVLEAVVLGGGYGRGQGGVLRKASGDRPYNDLEFYVLMRGNLLLNDRRYGGLLEKAAKGLSPEAGVHVELKITSRGKFERSPVSMFSYDLAAGHRIFFGDADLFRNCAHHLEAGKIPLHEATRLLFNRCSGLLLAKDFLQCSWFGSAEADFVGRNLAKAQLAFGDAVLTVFGQYHWDCRERHARLMALTVSEELPWLSEVRRQHAAGMEFKLHPVITPPEVREQLEEQHEELAILGRKVWLWVESRRLKRTFASSRSYALAPVRKCPESPAWRNVLLNMRTFGVGGLLGGGTLRYPRERLFNALNLLLWDERRAESEECRRTLRRNLRVARAAWPDLLSAYQKIWHSYG